MNLRTQIFRIVNAYLGLMFCLMTQSPPTVCQDGFSSDPDRLLIYLGRLEDKKCSFRDSLEMILNLKKHYEVQRVQNELRILETMISLH